MYNIRIVCVFFFCMGVWTGGAKRCYAQEKNQVLAERQRYRQELRHELKGEIQLSGAFALYPMAVKWAEEFRKIHPKVRIDISAGGAGKGITDALAKVVDLGMDAAFLWAKCVTRRLWNCSSSGTRAIRAASALSTRTARKRLWNVWKSWWMFLDEKTLPQIL